MKGAYFLKFKNGSLFANLEDPQNAFLQQIVFKRPETTIFSAGNGVLKKDRFVPVFWGNTNWEKLVPTSQS